MTDIVSRKLKDVQDELHEWIAVDNILRNKERNGDLSKSEVTRLNQVEKFLDEIEAREKFWRARAIYQERRQNEEKTLMSFQEAGFLWIGYSTGVDCKYRGWESFSAQLDGAVVPGPEFQQAFLRTTSAFQMQRHVGRRTIINLFLSTVVLLPEFKNALRIFPALPVSIESTEGSKKRKLYGELDYTVGLGKEWDITQRGFPDELALVVVHATHSDLEGDDLQECAAQAAALYRVRKNAGKQKCAVWGVVSTAVQWKFLKIDEDGKLWLSETLSLNLRTPKDDEINNIYRVIYYIVRCCYESRTPPASPRALDTRC